MRNHLKKIVGKFQSTEVLDTGKHAKLFAQNIKTPSIIFLSGDLGSGKTEWARAFVRAYLEKKQIVVPSPTYSLLNIYENGPKKVAHLDLYRAQSLEDLESLGFWDLVKGKMVICVEWADILIQHKELLPPGRDIFVLNLALGGGEGTEFDRKLDCRLLDMTVPSPGDS